MNAQIAPDGALMVERAGEFKVQQCPFTPIGPRQDEADCGDWCPCFTEPDLWEKPSNGAIALIHLNRGGGLMGRLWVVETSIRGADGVRTGFQPHMWSGLSCVSNSWYRAHKQKRLLYRYLKDAAPRIWARYDVRVREYSHKES